MLKGLIGAVGGLVVMAGATWVAAVAYINTDGGRLAEKYLQPFGIRGNIQYGSVEKSLFSGDLIINDIRIKTPDGQNLRIAKVLVRKYDWLSAKRPAFADVTLSSVVTDPATLGPVVRDQAAKAGVKSLKATMRYAFRYDEDSKALRVETIRIALEGVGTLTARAMFTGLPKPDLSRGGMIRTFALSRISSARLEFVDGDLAKKLIRAHGAGNGLSQDAARESILKALAALQKSSNNALLKEMYAAVESYIRKPGRIAIDIKPARPVRLMTLVPVFRVSPREVKRMLNLKISTAAKSR